MTDAVHGSPPLDPAVPNVARMYDFTHVTHWRPTEPPCATFDPFPGAVGVKN